MPAGSGTTQILNDNVYAASDTVASLHEEGHKIITVCCVMCALASASVVLRFVVKATGQRHFGTDDVLIFGALASYAATEYLITAGNVAKRTLIPFLRVTIQQLTSNPGVGAGSNALDDTSPEYGTYLKMTWIYSLLYWTTITFATLSILFLYQRIFAVQRAFCIASRVLIGLTLIWWISGSLCEALSWRPTHSYWELAVPGGFVIAYQDFWIASMVAELAIETAVLVLPVWEIAALLLNVEQRLLLIPLFCSGGLVLVTGAVRIQYAWNKRESENSRPLPFMPLCSEDGSDRSLLDSADMIPGTMWLSLHSSVAIISACLPTYGPILKSISRSSCHANRRSLKISARPTSPDRPNTAMLKDQISAETTSAGCDHRESFSNVPVSVVEYTTSAA